MKYISEIKLEEFKRNLHKTEYSFKSAAYAIDRLKRSYEALPCDIKKKLSKDEIKMPF